jgi:hypothetical protein
MSWKQLLFKLAGVDLAACPNCGGTMLRKPLAGLPDTGISYCYDDTQQITCPDSGKPLYGQDAYHVDMLEEVYHSFSNFLLLRPFIQLFSKSGRRGLCNMRCHFLQEHVKSRTVLQGKIGSIDLPDLEMGRTFEVFVLKRLEQFIEGRPQDRTEREHGVSAGGRKNFLITGGKESNLCNTRL